MDIQRFETIVIGAGMAGATAAANLALSGRKTALLEAEDSAGYHTTGRSAAIWILNYGSADARILTGASRAFFETPPPGFTEATLAHKRAVVFIAPPEQQAHLADMIAMGEGMVPIDPVAVRALVPALKPGYAVGGGIEADAFDMDVAALHQGYLRQLRQLGGALALRHRAGRVERVAGEWRVEALGGVVFAAPVVVNAAGAWGDEVAGLAGVRPVGLQPKRRTACIIDPGQFDVTDWPMLGDVDHSWYVRPEARSKLMVSPADETDDTPHDVQPDELDVAIAIDRMQQALDIPVRRIEHSWAGLRTFSPDRGLVIGPCEVPGFHWMCGQGGYGIQTAPAAGVLVAALVNGTHPGEELARAVPLTDPMRFQR